MLVYKEGTQEGQAEWHRGWKIRLRHKGFMPGAFFIGIPGKSNMNRLREGGFRSGKPIPRGSHSHRVPAYSIEFSK